MHIGVGATAGDQLQSRPVRVHRGGVHRVRSTTGFDDQGVTFAPDTVRHNHLEGPAAATGAADLHADTTQIILAVVR